MIWLLVKELIEKLIQESVSNKNFLQIDFFNFQNKLKIFT